MHGHLKIKVTENVKTIKSLCHLHLSNGFIKPLERCTWPCGCQEGIVGKWRYNSMHSSHQQQMAVTGQPHTPQPRHCWYPLSRHMKPMKGGSKQGYISEPFEWEFSVTPQLHKAHSPKRVNVCEMCVNLKNESDVYWTVHHCDNWLIKNQLDVTCFMYFTS